MSSVRKRFNRHVMPQPRGKDEQRQPRMVQTKEREPYASECQREEHEVQACEVAGGQESRHDKEQRLDHEDRPIEYPLTRPPLGVSKFNSHAEVAREVLGDLVDVPLEKCEARGPTEERHRSEPGGCGRDDLERPAQAFEAHYS